MSGQGEYRTFIDEGRFDVYTGHFEASLRHLHGVLMYADGGLYDGTWWYGRRSGEGVLHYPDVIEGDRYIPGGYSQGEWLENVLQGKGERRYSDDSVYNGLFEDGLRSGVGVMAYPEGVTFTGTYLLDQRHGHGAVLYSDERTFEGTWVHGKQDGAATLCGADGEVLVEERWAWGRLV
jgi:hypothetical protein